MRVRFGPAGKPLSYKGKSEQVPIYLKQLELDAYEYQAVRSLRISKESATTLGKNARACDVLLSLHAPYAINLSSEKEKTIEASIERLVKAVEVASWMGAYLVVFHPGYYGKYSQDEALRLVINSLEKVIERMKENNIRNVYLGIETTGKLSQVGSLDEVVEVCETLDRVRPVIDFAHIHAREGGKLKDKNDFIKIVNILESRLGSKALNPIHIHFTEVEYGEKGEIRHHPLGSGYGPNFKELAKALIDLDIDAVIICESPLLEEDAIRMKRILKELLASK